MTQNTNCARQEYEFRYPVLLFCFFFGCNGVTVELFRGLLSVLISVLRTTYGLYHFY